MTIWDSDLIDLSAPRGNAPRVPAGAGNPCAADGEHQTVLLLCAAGAVE